MTVQVMQMTANGLDKHAQQEAISILAHSYVDTLQEMQGDGELNFQMTKANTFGLLYDLLIEVETNTDKYSRPALLNKYTQFVTQPSGRRERMFNTSRDDLSEVDPDVTETIFKTWDRYLETLEDSKQYTQEFYNIKHIVVNRLGAGVGPIHIHMQRMHLHIHIRTHRHIL